MMRSQRHAVVRADRRSWVLFAAAASVVQLAATTDALAGPTYTQSQSSCVITHDANILTPLIDKTIPSFQIPPISLAPHWQINNTVSGVPSSTAIGSIGSVTNPTTATFGLLSGTGVTQVDSSHAHNNASSLKFDFAGVWNTGGTNFGPVASGYFSMAYGGTVGAGGFAQIKINMTFMEGANILRTAISNVVDTFTNSTASAMTFARTYTSSKPLLTGTVGSGKNIRVAGTIEFLADNMGSASDCNPLSMSLGGAPQTANWQPNTNGDWNQDSNWNPTLDPNNILDSSAGFNDLRVTPNSAAGIRARFANHGLTGPGSRAINILSPVTIGTLDIDDDDAYTFNAMPGAALTFDVQQGEAVIHNGSSGGPSFDDTVVNTPVVFGKSVQVDTEGSPVGGARGTLNASNIIINGQITETGGARTLTKVGEASLTLNAANNFSGGTGAKGGYLNANLTGSLGTGSVLADDGQLNYNAPHASAPAIVSNAQNNGQINLGIVPTTERFQITDLGAISGSSTELSALNALQPGGNLLLNTGAMIAHETFDTAETGNPNGIFGFGPQYIFGVAADLTSGGQNITVGSSSPGPWKGFGGDRGDRIFGSSPSTVTDSVVISGNGELVSLHNSITINARLQGVGPSPAIIKRGGGTVIINNISNPFAGPITVQGGTLAIGGGMNNIQSVTVSPGGAFKVLPGASFSAASINMAGGTLGFAGGTTNTGLFVGSVGNLQMVGGTFNVGTSGFNVLSNFTAQLSGGNLNVQGALPSSGTIVLDGGNVTVQQGFTQTASGNTFVTAGTFNASGTTSIARNFIVDGGVVAFHGNVGLSGAGFMRYNGGTLSFDNALTITNGSLQVGAGAQRLLKLGNVVTLSGGRVDLADNDMVATNSTYSAVAGQVASARAGGAWTGPGITSSTAANATPRNTTLGILTGAQYLSTGNVTFDGRNVVATDVLVKYTYYGDADFNGVVNFDDYARIDAGFNSGGTDWFRGDFDLSGVVNFDDYALIDLAFNTQSGTLREAVRLLDGKMVMGSFSGSPSLQKVLEHYQEFGAPYAHGFLSAVPEPGAGALCAAVAGALIRRRRRAG
ncbi:hypothetical protein BH09PLA1_BH09PLA1_05050 [soil metagenome]